MAKVPEILRAVSGLRQDPAGGGEADVFSRGPTRHLRNTVCSCGSALARGPYLGWHGQPIRRTGWWRVQGGSGCWRLMDQSPGWGWQGGKDMLGKRLVAEKGGPAGG